MSNVILFGLSANPPTGEGGHAGIVRWAAEPRPLPAFGGEAADEVWVLPVYRHAFTDKRGMPSFEHRHAMARLAFQSEMPEVARRVRVLDVERTLGRAANVDRQGPDEVRVGTIDVVRHLERAHPGARFALLLGADTHRDLLEGKWKESEALLSRVCVIALPRVGVGGAARADGPTLTAISSTEVRASRDLGFLGRVLQPSVLAYIRLHHLYGFARRAEDPQDSDRRG